MACPMQEIKQTDPFLITRFLPCRQVVSPCPPAGLNSRVALGVSESSRKSCRRATYCSKVTKSRYVEEVGTGGGYCQNCTAV